MADSITWDTTLPKKQFGRSFSIKLHKNSAVSHMVKITLESNGDKPVDLGEALLSKRVVTVQNSTRLPSTQSEEEFAAKCKALNGATYPLVPAAGAVRREPTTEEAITVLSKAINDGTLSRENASPDLIAKCDELGIDLQ